MDLTSIPTLIGLLCVAGLVYVSVFNRTLGRAIWARITGTANDIANTIDSAKGRMELAIQKLKQQQIDAETTLTDIKTRRKKAERRLAEAQRKYDFAKTKAENYASVGKAERVKQALVEQDSAQKQVEQWNTTVAMLAKSEESAEQTLRKLREQELSFQSEKLELGGRLEAAKSAEEARALVRGLVDPILTEDGDVKRARELVTEMEERLAATTEVDALLDEDEDEFDGDGNVPDELDVRVARLMAQFDDDPNTVEDAHSSTPTNGAAANLPIV